MKRNVDVLGEGVWDLLIVGGGITGAGVALDATLRGLRVALIDKGDFASGTSSASSKLIHGGLRYLEQAAFGLVYEALAERRHLLHNASHLVAPLRFLIPFYRHARIAPWKWRLGLTLYDLLAGRSLLRRSRPLTVPALRAEFPTLLADGLLGGAEYFDAQMDDARLCLEVLATAASAGAEVANYVEAVALDRIAEGLLARVLDRVSGRELRVRARQVLNATGPWLDAVCRLAGDSAEPRLQPTKGVHLLVPGQGHSTAFLLLHPRDGRVLFVLPWLGKTLIGTTDTFTPETPDELTVQPDEVAYLLEAYNHHFTATLSARNVLGSFAGLRPLLRARSGEPSSRSREFRLFVSPSGLLSAAGGKYTTYRRMAEQITDAILRRLGRWQSCRTHTFPLVGTPSEPLTAVAANVAARLSRQGCDPTEAQEVAEHLARRYGGRASDVASYLQTREERARVVEREPDRWGEFAYQRDHEMARFPADLLLRRTRLGLFHPQLLSHLNAQLTEVSGHHGLC